MELLVELLEKDTFLEYPTRRMAHGVHFPTLADDTVFDHTGIGNERVHAIARHHRHRVTVVNSRSRVFLLLLT